MDYKLINTEFDIDNCKEVFFKNRGVKDWRTYTTLNNGYTHPWERFEDIEKAVRCLNYHVENKHRIHIVVDSDVDGYTSGAMMYQYLKMIDDTLQVTYSLHTKKQHGLTPDIVIPDDVELIIIPDAGSNDVEECKRFSESNVDIIILDHHIIEKDNPHAIVINNQRGGYPNKNFCGAGVVYKFLQALDSYFWTDYADHWLDLVALANIADAMDIREYETKYYIDKGLRNIKNLLFKAIIKKQDYSLKGEITIHNMQFYVIPSINSMIRMGTQEEKRLMFQAFIEEYEEFDYVKRDKTTKEQVPVVENIYDRVARLCSNAHSRQQKAVEKAIPAIEERIDEQDVRDDKVLFINATNAFKDTLGGLVAGKVADIEQKPCLILRLSDASNDKDMTYVGSCRNSTYSPVTNLKQFLLDTKCFNMVQGHENAAGISIDRSNIVKAINKCNATLKDFNITKTTYIDFEMNFNDLSIGFIRDIDSLRQYYGKNLEEPFIVIHNVPIMLADVILKGKAKNTWSVSFDNCFEIIKFNAKQDDLMLKQINGAYERGDNFDESYVVGYIDILGTASVNNYKNILTPQITINDYQFVE